MDYQKLAEYFLPALLALVYTLAAKYASGAIGSLLEKVVELLNSVLLNFRNHVFKLLKLS